MEAITNIELIIYGVLAFFAAIMSGIGGAGGVYYFDDHIGAVPTVRLTILANRLCFI